VIGFAQAEGDAAVKHQREGHRELNKNQKNQ
jgi:hypothetical protein